MLSCRGTIVMLWHTDKYGCMPRLQLPGKNLFQREKLLLLKQYLRSPVKVVAAAVQDAVDETAPVEPEAAAKEPTTVKAVPEAVPEATAESGFSDPSEGKVKC